MAVTTQAEPKPALGAAYWRLWWANAVDNAGDGAFAAALPLLAVTLTRDPLLVSTVSTATFLPWLLVSLPAGALVDSRDRATLMWRAQLVQGAVVTVIAVLVALHLVSIWALAAGGLCLGSAQVVFDNASQSVLPVLVAGDALPRANGSLFAVQVISGSFLGLPAGSALFALAPVAPFAVDAASFAGSAALLKGLPRSAPRTGKQGAGSRPGAGPARECAGWPGTGCCGSSRSMLAVSGFAAAMGSATFVSFRDRDAARVGARVRAAAGVVGRGAWSAGW